MLQSPLFECFSFDPFSFQQNGLPASEVDVGGREVFQTPMISLMVVVANEAVDLRFQIARKVVVIHVDAGFYVVGVPDIGDED
jgi:hypothetical protein